MTSDTLDLLGYPSTDGSKYRSMKALLSGVAPGRAWNAGTFWLVSPSRPFSSPQLIEARQSTGQALPGANDDAPPGLLSEPYSALNFIPAVKPKGLAV